MTNTEAQAREPGSLHQTFLVGSHVYLRSFVPGDEKNATSWRASVFPKSPELMEKWIKEELPKELREGQAHLAIVRKIDDIVVGSLQYHNGELSSTMSAYVDVLYGDQGQYWLAEAILLAAHWQVDECHIPAMLVTLPANREIAIEEIHKGGFTQTACWREMIEQGGQRVDKLAFTYFNAFWASCFDTSDYQIGNPDMPVSPQPIAPAVVLDGDPPAQAIAIGQRIYLRVQDKDDGRFYVDAARKETETFFEIGRGLYTDAEWSDFLASTDGDDFPDMIWFTVCLRDTDEAIGAVGLLNVDYVNRVAETGAYVLSAEHRGQGYGPEAKQLLLDYTFNTLGFHMVTSFVYESNTRSVAALGKQGYRTSGRVCWLYPFEGHFADMLTFDLLASEWRGLPKQS